MQRHLRIGWRFVLVSGLAGSLHARAFSSLAVFGDSPSGSGFNTATPVGEYRHRSCRQRGRASTDLRRLLQTLRLRVQAV